MYVLLSVTVGLTFWVFVGWCAYRIYRAVATRIPALDHAVNNRVQALRRGVPSDGNTTRGVTYLWALGNHHARYRRPTNEVSEEDRFSDAA